MKFINYLLLFTLIFSHSILAANQEADTLSVEHKLQALLNNFIEKHPTTPGIILTVDSNQLDLHWSGASGVDDVKTKTAIKPEQPVRIASNTKTYVAAAILRLMEQGKLAIGDTIDVHLPKHQLAMLKHGDYNPQKITIAHLLAHTSAIWDYAQSDTYFKAISVNPTKRWTRDQQIKFAMEHGKSYGSPGEYFNYSDTGYILLGEIIEQRTSLDLAKALRKLLKYEQLGMKSTWLETLEQKPENTPPQAHQYMKTMDTIDWDPSFDLYGGGGLVASMPDMAKLYRALFDGQLFNKPQTLQIMLTSLLPSHGGFFNKDDSAKRVYGLGIITYQYRSHTIFVHNGWWGTSGAYIPDLDLAISFAVTEQDKAKELKIIRETILDVIIEHSE